MFVDTSALIAILRNEPEAEACARAIENGFVRRTSAANFVEAAVIIDASRLIPSPAGVSTNSSIRRKLSLSR